MVKQNIIIEFKHSGRNKMTKVTFNIPGYPYPIKVNTASADETIKADAKSKEASDPSRSQEGNVNNIIASLISKAGAGSNKERINSILEKIQPYLDKINSEIRKLYVEYKDAVKYLRDTEFIKAIVKHYGNAITVRENPNSNLNEENFVNHVIKANVTAALYIIEARETREKLQKDYKYHTRFCIWNGAFNKSKVKSGDNYDNEYGKYLFKILTIVDKYFRKKYSHFFFSAGIDMDSLEIEWEIIAKYDISKGLLQQILKASPKTQEK
jgi:hypothetical protein